MPLASASRRRRQARGYHPSHPEASASRAAESSMALALQRLPATLTRTRRSTYLTLLVVSAVWGAQFALGKILVTGMPGMTLAFARSAIAATLFVLFASTLPGGLYLRREHLGSFLLLAIIGTPLYQGAFFLGLQLAPASDGALLLPTMNPVFTVLVSALLGYEAPSRRHLAGMALSGVGVAIIFAAIERAEPSASSPNSLLGDLLFLAGSLCWGIFSSVGSRVFAVYGAVRGTAVASAIGLLPMAVLGWLAGDMGSLLTMSPSGVWIVLFLGVLGGFLGFMMFNQSIASIGAGATARFNNLVPVWGLVVAVVLLDERPSPLQLVGSALIVAGVWTSSSGPRGRPRQP